jgi:hypothetical protein
MNDGTIATMRARGFERFFGRELTIAAPGLPTGLRWIIRRLLQGSPVWMSFPPPMSEAMGAPEAVKSWYWPFQAREDGLPEKLIDAGQMPSPYPFTFTQKLLRRPYRHSHRVF